MEIRRIIQKGILRCMLSCVCFFAGAFAYAQPATAKYSISKGNMQITVNKKLSDETLNEFVKKYDLSDLQLRQFLRSNFADSIKAQGWNITVNNSSTLVLTKPFLSSDDVNDPTDMIKMTGLGIYLGTSTPAPMNNAVFGRNKFRNSRDFYVKDSVVTFVYRNPRKADHVKLAGNFTDWAAKALEMKQTDTGWIAQVKLAPGKYLYKFVSDGNWTIDPENGLTENDDKGNTNSVFYVANKIFSIDGYNNAKRVYLSGSFVDWDENQLRMNKTANGWELPLYLDSGTYTYRFIVDKKWMTDPKNTDKFPNEFGESNSVVRIGKAYIFKMHKLKNAPAVFLAGSFNQWRKFELPMTKTNDGWEISLTLGAGNFEYKYFVEGKGFDSSGIMSRDDLPGQILVIDPNYTFRLKGKGTAKTIFLAGDFNGWSPRGYPMQKDGDDWVLPMHLSTGKHLYKYIIDGNWMTDPTNKLWEQNEYNTGNSVLWVP